MSELSDKHIGQLLRDAFARFEDELIAGTPPFEGVELRATHNHVLRHLDREPDPADGRAKRIVYTPAGIRAFDEGRKLIAAIEREWKRELGAKQWAALREALRELTG